APGSRLRGQHEGDVGRSAWTGSRLGSRERSRLRFVTTGCFNPNGESETRSESRINEFIDDIGGLLIPCSPSPGGTPCGASDCRGRLMLCLPDISGAPVCADTTACGSACTSDTTCEPGRACVAVLGANRCCDICE